MNKGNLATKVANYSMKLIFQYRKVLFILAIFTFFSLDGIAQPPPPGGTATPPCWPPPCIPIDGGIGFLVAAGVAYGAKKSWDFGKKKEIE